MTMSSAHTAIPGHRGDHTMSQRPRLAGDGRLRMPAEGRALLERLPPRPPARRRPSTHSTGRRTGCCSPSRSRASTSMTARSRRGGSRATESSTGPDSWARHQRRPGTTTCTTGWRIATPTSSPTTAATSRPSRTTSAGTWPRWRDCRRRESTRDWDPAWGQLIVDGGSPWTPPASSSAGPTRVRAHDVRSIIERAASGVPRRRRATA